MTPTLDQVLSLPATTDKAVPPEYIDPNGHMNIGDYFREASVSVWVRMSEAAMGEDYIAQRGSSFFTVEHSIRYLGELREGQRFSVHCGFVDHTEKAVHAVAFVVDREHDRLACVMEFLFVHVSMTTRRSSAIPDDVAAALDDVIAAQQAPWLPEVADRLTLRRPSAPQVG